MTLSSRDASRMLAALATPNVVGARPARAATAPAAPDGKAKARKRAKAPEVPPVVPPPPLVKLEVPRETVPSCPHVRQPHHLVSVSNLREHPAVRTRRTNEQRGWGRFAMEQLARHLWTGPLPMRVRMVRIAPDPVDDDNLRGSFKSIRDGIAAALGVRDDPRDGRASWEYGQEKGPSGFRVELPGAER